MSTESTTDTSTPKTIPSPSGYAENTTTPAEADDTTDDFGYPIIKDAIPTPPPVAPVTEAKPVDKAVTGYGKESEAEAVKDTPPVTEAAKTEVPTTDEEKVKAELAEVVKELPDSIDKDKLTKFALDNKLTKEQLVAYSNLVKEDQKNSEASQKEAVKAQRLEWKNELAKDPEFGGEYFDKNVDRVEKVLENYMPNMKKVLTERGSVLPPYIMRDLLALSKVLNPTTNLVIGEVGQAEGTDKNFLDELYN